jgi:cellulose synthase/poly-beta-1,6-N-acetylglucosamine synthase-like glycosyltransferase
MICDAPAMKRDVYVSVIIPHYNDLHALRVCIAGLHQQSWPADQMEIIIADNNSSCGLAAVSALATGCRVVSAPIQGAGPARNVGAAASAGGVLAFIDSDCRPSPSWLEEGVRMLQDCDFVGGDVQMLVRDPARPTAVEAWELVFGFNFKRYILKEGYTGSGNMFVRRGVFEAVGGFRTGVSEDMDWSFRARREGYHLGYAPRAIVQHLARSHWSELLRRWRRVITEHHSAALERPLGRLRWLVRIVAMPLSIIPHTVRVLMSDQLPNSRAKAGAIWVLICHRLWRAAYMTRVTIAPRHRRDVQSRACESGRMKRRA